MLWKATTNEQNKKDADWELHKKKNQQKKSFPIVEKGVSFLGGPLLEIVFCDEGEFFSVTLCTLFFMAILTHTNKQNLQNALSINPQFPWKKHKLKKNKKEEESEKKNN